MTIASVLDILPARVPSLVQPAPGDAISFCHRCIAIHLIILPFIPWKCLHLHLLPFENRTHVSYDTIRIHFQSHLFALQ
jgi:hypothetical protein